MPRNLLAARRDRIHQAVSTLTTGAQRRYPAPLRSQIAAYGRERIQAGTAASRVCSEIGVSHPTLVRILDEKPAPLRRVRVVRPGTATKRPKQPLVVKGPNGLIIEGFDVEGVAALVRALS